MTLDTSSASLPARASSQRRKGRTLDVVLPAALLHELVSLPKNHPDTPRSGVLCAERAADCAARKWAILKGR